MSSSYDKYAALKEAEQKQVIQIILKRKNIQHCLRLNDIM